MDKKICRVSDVTGGMLVKQMGNEMYNHFLYLAMANFCALEGVVDLETYFRKRAHEEHVHFMWIYDYLNECDFEFKIPTVEQIKEEIDDFVTIFQETVKAEIKTSNDIDAIYDHVVSEKDSHTRQWLDQKLIPEQHEEETTSRTALDIITFTDTPILDRASKILELLD